MKEATDKYIKLHLLELANLYENKLTTLLGLGNIIPVSHSISKFMNLNPKTLFSSDEDEDYSPPFSDYHPLTVCYVMNNIYNWNSCPNNKINFNRFKDIVITYMMLRYEQIIYGKRVHPVNLPINLYLLLIEIENNYCDSYIMTYLQLCKQNEVGIFLKKFKHKLDKDMGKSLTKEKVKYINKLIFIVSRLVYHREFKIKKKIIIPVNYVKTPRNINIIANSSCFTLSKKTIKQFNYNNCIDNPFGMM